MAIRSEHMPALQRIYRRAESMLTFDIYDQPRDDAL